MSVFLNEYEYRDTSLIRKHLLLGPYSRLMPRALWGSEGGGRLFMSQVPLHLRVAQTRCLVNPIVEVSGRDRAFSSQFSVRVFEPPEALFCAN